MKKYLKLRAAGKIAEEIISRKTLTLILKSGATVKIPMSLEIRKAVNT